MKIFKNFFKKDELKLLWPFYTSNIFYIFFIYSAFYVLYFRELGFSLLQIGAFISVGSLAGILFEIPTGAIADIYGRKFSSLLGTFLMGITIFLMFFFTNFYILLMLFFFLAVFYTFISGAEEAWTIDLLKSKRKKNLVDEFYVKDSSITNLSMFIAGIIGALIVAKFGLRSIWPVTGISIILMGITLSFGKEHFIRKKQHVKEYTKRFFKQTKDSYKYSLRNKAISLILFASFFWAISFGFSSDILWIPLLKNFGLKNYLFGFIFSATFALGIFSPFLARKLSRKTKGKKQFLIYILGFMCLLSFSVFFINSLIPLLLIYLVYLSCFDFFGPINRPFFQRFIPSKMRATITSFRQFIFSLTGIFIPLLIGFLGDKIGPKFVIPLGIFVLIPVILLYNKIPESQK